MNFHIIEQLIQKHGADRLVQQLEPFVTEPRKNKIETVINAQLNSIQVAMELPRDIHNALAAVRSCEVFGASKIHIIKPYYELSHLLAVTKGACRWVEIYYYSNLTDFLAYCQRTSVILVGAAPTATTHLSAVAINRPLCLLLGNEIKGLTPEAQQSCDILYKIPMYGMTESLNLSVAAGISLHDLTSRKRQQLQQLGDLTLAEKTAKRAHYYLNSMDPRVVKGLI